MSPERRPARGLRAWLQGLRHPASPAPVPDTEVDGLRQEIFRLEAQLGFYEQAERTRAERSETHRRQFVQEAFSRLLRRSPTQQEQTHWEAVTAHAGPGEVLRLIQEGDEYLHRNRVHELSEFRAGHFYSPVVDPEELRARGFTVDRKTPESSLAGIDLRPDAMQAFWDRNCALMAEAAFPQSPTPPLRYYTGNELYSWGDALVLLAMIHEARPQRIIEIGSGFSSACMLDIADRLRLPTRFTFVEPYPERLYGLLTEADRARCTVRETAVQDCDPTMFDALEPGDILFIDSTHVSKAGSDVNFELFEVLPRLKSGVIVHFHDMFYPFEYPEDWIFRARRSWNEAYILRAFLMHNPTYEVLFFNDYFRARHAERAAEVPLFNLNPGGGLWLRRT